jgi:prepilin-type N-terminal cleavage/methylation domain-containing protein
MATSIVTRNKIVRANRKAEAGFSLLEVIISMTILTVGMVSLLGVFGLAMATTQTSQQDLIAKQLANEAYESIMTARNTSQMNWDNIQNVGSTNCPLTNASSCGIFLTGFQPMYNSGADGIFGTADDSAAGEETIQDPGPDGIFQTADDTFIPLTGYQRQITISPLYDTGGNLISTLRSTTVTVQYQTSQAQTKKTYSLNSFISEFQ